VRTVTIREIRRLLPEMEGILGAEGELILTQHGRPVARLVALQPALRRRPSNADLRALMPPQETTSEQLVREDRDARA
jgi:antitoxin (DNA-binding transcriptional repressor) of toxin-antitoxin stability system